MPFMRVYPLLSPVDDLETQVADLITDALMAGISKTDCLKSLNGFAEIVMGMDETRQKDDGPWATTAASKRA